MHNYFVCTQKTVCLNSDPKYCVLGLNYSQFFFCEVFAGMRKLLLRRYSTTSS